MVLGKAKKVFAKFQSPPQDLEVRHGRMKLTRLMVQTWTHGIGMDLWYGNLLMVWTWTNGIKMDSWHRHGLMVLTNPIIILVVLTHTHTHSNTISID